MISLIIVCSSISIKNIYIREKAQLDITVYTKKSSCVSYESKNSSKYHQNANESGAKDHLVKNYKSKH